LRIHCIRFKKCDYRAKCDECWVGVSYDLSGILKNATNVKSLKARLWKYKTLKRCLPITSKYKFRKPSKIMI
jgi:hypothetical protein